MAGDEQLKLIAKVSGVSLIELMVAVVILGIIAVIAVPSYQQHIIKSRRTAATACLIEQVQVMERSYTANMSYANIAAAPNLQCVIDLDTSYTFNLVSDARTFRLSAVPSHDPSCGTLTINQSGVKQASGGSVVDCW